MIAILRKALAGLLAFFISLSPVYLPVDARCEPKFNGTFLQSWMCREWDNARWSREFICMREAGIEYLILQCTAEKSINGGFVCDYSSSVEALSGAYCGSPVVETALSLAQGCGMKVFIGLANYDGWWNDAGASVEYAETCRLSADMAQEIYSLYHSKYPDALYGWYFVPEINNAAPFRANIAKIAKGVAAVASRLSEKTPGMPLMLSPFFSSSANDVSYSAMLRMWVRFFKNAGLRAGDILAPQDSMGGNAVDNRGLERRWSMYYTAVKNAGGGVKLWANCELFTCGRGENGQPVAGDDRGFTQTLGRFCNQLAVASKYAENIITFSYNHYMSPELVNRVFHDTYVDYVKNGFALDAVAPSAPESVRCESVAGGVKISWDASSDNIGIAYYRVLRGGEFLANAQALQGDAPTEYFDAGAQCGETGYTVEAVDGAGNRSALKT